MPPIPETGWKAPRDFPNLTGARCISLDTETYDPELKKRGPGWARGKGHIVGVSLAVDGGKWYFPVRHSINPEENMDPFHVFAYLQDTLAGPCPKVGANLYYDLGWLKTEGVELGGTLVDVQYAEALLSEADKVGLDDLASRYLKENKETSILYQWCSDYYGGAANGDQRANIHRAPPSLVGKYAEADADLPLRIAPYQYHRLAAEGLLDVFEMECELIRLLVEMRFAGVRVDIPKAEQVSRAVGERIKLEQEKLNHLCGMKVNANSADEVAKAFDHFGYEYPRTAPTKNKPKGSPSFQKAFLEHADNPVAEQVLEIRKLSKLKGTFIDSYILDSHINGMVYGQFHSMRGIKGGTRSGRLSSSTPNLQNVPSRDKELAPMIRGMFVPDIGHRVWRRYDYSQIEYRFLVHFAEGPGAAEAREHYWADPNTDYHEFVIALLKRMAGIELDRKPAKNINFGLIYGMGIPKLIRTLGMTRQEGKKLFDAYHVAIPYAKNTMELCSRQAQQIGWIDTILGRRSRFELWEPADWQQGGERMLALPYSQARRLYGDNIQRSHTHKALNRRLQGSAAELLKKGMYECWKQGIFAATGIPRLTVHDELGFSDPGGREGAFREMKYVMENAIPLRVPVIAECEIGPDWGHVEKV